MLPDFRAAMLLKEARIVEVSHRLDVSVRIDEVNDGTVLVEPPDQIAQEDDACWLDEVQPLEVEHQLWRPTIGAGGDYSIG
jgi:hypothetical protein